MSRVALYFDEDSSDNDVAAALRRAGVDIRLSSEAGMNGRADIDQLSFAASEGRVLLTSNVRDYAVLHRQWMAAGRHHAGVVFVIQQRWNVGELVRRIQRFASARSAEQLLDGVDHLSDWGPESRA